MAERVNQHLNPIIGSNIRRLQEERGMKSTEVIAKLQLMDINVISGIYSKVLNGRNNPSVIYGKIVAATENEITASKGLHSLQPIIHLSIMVTNSSVLPTGETSIFPLYPDSSPVNEILLCPKNTFVPF